MSTVGGELFGRIRPAGGRTATVDEVPDRWVGIVTRLPDRILLILLCVFVGAYVPAALGVYVPGVVLPLMAVLLVVGWRFVPKDIVPTRGKALTAIVAIVLALVWVAVQVPFETEFIVASRDPGIYSNIAAALASTGHSTLDVAAAARDAHGILGATDNLGSFGADGTTLQLQGGNALPSLLGLGYWIAGIDGLTVVNSVLGGVALIGVYTLARRLLGPALGLLPALILGISMPMVYFSRAPYTEILSLALFVAAVSMIWAAFRTGRIRDFLGAGLFAGAACMTRLDSLLGVASLLAAFALVLLGVSRPRATFSFARAWIAYAAPVVVFGLVGFFDLRSNYPAYLVALAGQSKALWAVAALTIVAGGVIVVVRRAVAARGAAVRAGDRSAVTTLGRGLSDRAASRLGVTLAVLNALLFVYWAARPLFFHTHFTDGAYGQGFVETIQQETGLPIDGTRRYDEYSLYWFVWYFGVPFVIAAGLGLSALIHRAIARRRPGLLFFVVVVLGVALLYLNKINITPDQMWAFRRVLPIITPGFVISAAWIVKWLGTRSNRAAVGAAGVVALLLVGGTALTWHPRLFVTTEYSNQANELRAVCAKVGDAKSVIFVTSASNAYPLTLDTFCGLEVVTLQTGITATNKTGMTKPQIQQSLAKLEARLGAGTPVLTFTSTLVAWDGATPTPLQQTVIDVWQRTLLSAPATFGASTRVSWLGAVESNGLVRAR